jgi:hypothetical protein
VIAAIEDSGTPQLLCPHTVRRKTSTSSRPFLRWLVRHAPEQLQFATATRHRLSNAGKVSVAA